MSFQYAGKAFEESRPLHTLVLVGMVNRVEDAAAPPVMQCQSALRHARRNGLPVCFLHEMRGAHSHKRGWIEGLEPTRHDQLFVRRGPSCFDSPYFAEAVSRTLVLAGFFTRDAIRATAHDAVHNGRMIIFLEDAIVQPPGSPGLAIESLAARRIRNCSTQCWIDATDPLAKF